VFHIQTEDSGIKSPRIVTHLFADGGRIIKTARTSYAELIGRADMSQVVRQMMKDQHKSMFTALRVGDLDVLLEASCGPLPLPPTESRAPGTESAPASGTGLAASAIGSPPSAPDRSASSSRPNHTLSNPNIYKIPPSVAPASREAIDLAVGSLEKLDDQAPSSVMLKGPVKSEPPPKARKSSPASARTGRTPTAPMSHIPARPAARSASAPSKSSQSIFGDGVISEKSLDEVILSYLAEDLDGSSD
jgi:hypothetical protein